MEEQEKIMAEKAIALSNFLKEKGLKLVAIPQWKFKEDGTYSLTCEIQLVESPVP